MSTATNDSPPPTAWGALLAGLANASLFTIASAYVPATTFLLAAVGLAAVAAGFFSPQRTHFAAVVLTLTGPFVFGHSPTPLGGIALHVVSACWDTNQRGACLLGAASSVYVLTLGFVCTYPFYRLLVQIGAKVHRLFRRFAPLPPAAKRPFTDTQNIFPQ